MCVTCDRNIPYKSSGLTLRACVRACVCVRVCVRMLCDVCMCTCMPLEVLLG